MQYVKIDRIFILVNFGDLFLGPILIWIIALGDRLHKIKVVVIVQKIKYNDRKIMNT